MTSKPAI